MLPFLSPPPSSSIPRNPPPLLVAPTATGLTFPTSPSMHTLPSSRMPTSLAFPTSPSTRPRPLNRSSASTSDASTRHLLKYYTRLTSKLARSSRLRDFLMIAGSVLTSSAVTGAPQFVTRISARMVSEGITSILGGGNLEEVLDFMREVNRLGISAASLFDKSAMDALAVECRRLVNQERLEEFVGLMETLASRSRVFFSY